MACTLCCCDILYFLLFIISYTFISRLAEFEKGGRDPSEFLKWQENMRKVLSHTCYVILSIVGLADPPIHGSRVVSVLCVCCCRRGTRIYKIGGVTFLFVSHCYQSVKLL